jgi:hypothetical protein
LAPWGVARRYRLAQHSGLPDLREVNPVNCFHNLEVIP